MNENEISYKIRGAIYHVYNGLGPGLLESAYEAALMYQLKIDGLKVESQVPIDVVYDGKILTYLKLTGLHLGILVNFNTENINLGIIRIVNNL